MVEISLNVDPMGGLWPVMPAPATASDDDLEIDAAFAAILQSQPVQPVVMPTGAAPGLPEMAVLQEAKVQGLGFDLVQGAAAPGARQVLELDTTESGEPAAPAPSIVYTQTVAPALLQQLPSELPEPESHGAAALNAAPERAATHVKEPAAAMQLAPISSLPLTPNAVGENALPVSELPGFSPAESVGLKPDGSESPVPDGFGAAPRRTISERAFSELPGFSPAVSVGLKPDGSETRVPAGSESRVPDGFGAASRRTISERAFSELPGFSPAESVGLKSDGSETPVPAGFEAAPRRAFSELPGFSPAQSVGLKPDGSEIPVTVGLGADPRRRFSELPGFSPAQSVGLTPEGSEIQVPEGSTVRVPGGSEIPPAGLGADRRQTPSELPGFSPAESVGLKPVSSEIRVTPDSTAPASAPLQQVLVPTTEDGAPVMPRLVEMMRWQAREGGGQAELRLRPELLGAVTVSIVVENGAVKATVSAETPAALEYLRSESSGLQEALEERGLTLDEFEVREESPLTDRRHHDDEQRKERQDAAPAPRRRVVNDSDAVFSVLA